jgi:outer membrane lipoprotein carrier protein
VSLALRCLLGGTFIVVAFVASVPAQDTRSILKRFEDRYRFSKTLQARFFERYLENGREVRSEAGIAYFARPGKMRWEYESPERNLYLIDGKWAWFYTPADHTVTRIRAKQSSDWRTPLALLAGEMKVSRICEQVNVDTALKPGDSQNVMLRCVLRGQDLAAPADRRDLRRETNATNEKVSFEVNPITGALARILVADPGGIQIEFRFADWTFDPPLSAEKFRFQPPQGVAIVNGDLAGRASPTLEVQ